MLLQFIVENFLSFENETIFNLIATKNKEHADHVIHTDKKVDVLSIAALYGANASGKSNLIKALAFAKELILNGTKPEQLIGHNFFKLNKECYTKPGKFEFLIYIDTKVYHYSFSFDKERIYEEWLYVKNKKGFVKYFQRQIDSAGKSNFEFGQSFIDKASKNEYQFLKFVMQGTRKNQLFLTETIDKNVEKLKDLYNWFNNTLLIVPADSQYAFLPLKVKNDQKFNKFLCEILHNISTDIDSIKVTESPLDIKNQFPGMDEKIINEISANAKIRDGIISDSAGKLYSISRNDNDESLLIKLKTRHKVNNSDEAVDFEFEEESDGTKRFIHLVPALVNLINNDRVVFIDELERRLHPLLCKTFVNIYLKAKSANSQLVFTTHDTNLLTAELFRRDEIWFTEKDEKGASHLSSMVDYKTRNDLNYEKGYLNGRFGAIPLLQGMENIEQLLK